MTDLLFIYLYTLPSPWRTFYLFIYTLSSPWRTFHLFIYTLPSPWRTFYLFIYTLPSPWRTFYLFIYTHFPLHDGPFIYLFIYTSLSVMDLLFIYTLPSPWRTFYLFIYQICPQKGYPTSVAMQPGWKAAIFQPWKTAMDSTFFVNHTPQSSCGTPASMANLKFPFSWLRPFPAACRLFILSLWGSLSSFLKVQLSQVQPWHSSVSRIFSLHAWGLGDWSFSWFYIV